VVSTSHAAAQSFVSRTLQLQPAIQPSESATDQNVRVVRRLATSLLFQAHTGRPWAAIMNDGTVVFGAKLDNKERLLRICHVGSKVEEEDGWSCGAVDSLSISPSGRYVFFGEDNGRFCLVDMSDNSATEYWLPVILAAEDGTYTGLGIGTVSWLFGSETAAISYVDGTIVCLDCESGNVQDVCRRTSIESTDVATKDVKDSLPDSLDEFVNGGIDCYVIRKPEIPLTSKVLAFGPMSYAVGHFRGPLEIVFREKNDAISHGPWSEGLSTGPSRFLVFAMAGRTLKCRSHYLDDTSASHEWGVSTPRSFNRGHLLVTSLAECPEGDLVVAFDVGQTSPVWQTRLRTSSNEAQLQEVSRPSTFQAGDIAVAACDGVSFLGLEIDRDGGSAALRKRSVE
jgi:hypothetical protein